MRWVRLAYLVFVMVSGLALAQEPAPVGEQFQVNSYFTSYQWGPSVAADTQGDFVVTWVSDGSYGTDTSDYSIQAQRFDATGSPLGGQFQVNSNTAGWHYWPAMATDPQGNFVVTWVSSTGWNVQAQRYDSSGFLLGGEFQVNSYATHTQRMPSVAADLAGNLVVVWESHGSYGTDTSSFSIQARRYDAGGSPVGGQFQVNSYTTLWQERPDVATNPQGDFIVVWTSLGSFGTDTEAPSVQAQLFDASGAPVGGELQVNSYTTSGQSKPAVAVDSMGNFVVVWESEGSYNTDTSQASIQAQRYDPAGNPMGGQFQVNVNTQYEATYPSIAIGADGDFVVVWNSLRQGSAEFLGQRFDIEGAPSGGEFQVNAYTASSLGFPSIAAGGNGNFVVVWESYGSYGTDTDESSIQGQRFSITAIFTDGFESGITSVWSETVGLVPTGPITFISLQVTPGSVPRTGGILTLSALVRDNVGQGVTNAPVAFTTEAGTLGSGGAIVLTGLNGLASDNLTLTSGDIDALGTRTFRVEASTVDFTGGLIVDSFQVNVQTGAPVADFDFSVNGLEVIFLNASTGDPVLSYSWNFGDGTQPPNRFDQNPVHSYAVNNMVYTVTLTVTNSIGTDSIQKSVTVGIPP